MLAATGAGSWSRELRELEQRALREQSAARAARAREEALRRECDEEAHQLRRLELEHAAAREDFEAESVEPLQRSESQAAALLRQEHSAETAAHGAAERLRGLVLDLSSDCGRLLLDTLDDPRGTAEAARACSLLRAALPATHPARQASELDDLLRILEDESADVRAVLSGVSNRGRGGPDALQALRDDTEALQAEVREVEAEARRRAARAEQLPSEAAVAGEPDALEDLLAEAAQLRRESGLWRRQQAEWEKSQVRMLRLVEDLQRQRVLGAQSQALVAKRLRELRREALPVAGQRQLAMAASGEDRKLEGLLTENSALQRQISRLERERVELIGKKKGLVSFVNTKMPQLQASLEVGDGPAPQASSPKPGPGRGSSPEADQTGHREQLHLAVASHASGPAAANCYPPSP